MAIEIGSRVQINPKHAGGYRTPWSARVKRGLFGRVSGKSDWGWNVQLDMPKRAKWVHDWLWHGVKEDELVEVSE